MSARGTMSGSLQRFKQGDRSALDEFVPHLDEELRRRAHHHLRLERTGRSLQTTDLVHEADLRLVGAEVALSDRAHLLALAAHQMRRVLIDRARARGTAKRGGGSILARLDGAPVATAADGRRRSSISTGGWRVWPGRTRARHGSSRCT